MRINIKKRFFVQLFIIAAIVIFVFSWPKEAPQNNNYAKSAVYWQFQSVDTMKYSRDVAREKLNDQSYEKNIDDQVRKIAASGATHVAVATPYDDEFNPFLEKWVNIARKYNIHVWFRGNWSGWEGWFEYPKISREEHIAKTKAFILNNQNLFQDGDIFSACPECENGGSGDPRQTGDTIGFRKFITDEYAVTKQAFHDINKSVSSNYVSMNGDVARLIMDQETTTKMDGMVTIDHYVETPEKLISDIQEIQNASGGKIVLGEFGAPIPDINGELSEEEQAVWVKNALVLLSQNKDVIGVNYWTNMGSSTALWDDNGHARKVVGVLTAAYHPELLKVTVKDNLGDPITNAIVKTGEYVYAVDKKGVVQFPKSFNIKAIIVVANNFKQKAVFISEPNAVNVVLENQRKDIFYYIRKISHFFYK